MGRTPNKLGRDGPIRLVSHSGEDASQIRSRKSRRGGTSSKKKKKQGDEDAGESPPKFEAPRTMEEEDDDSTLDGEVWRTTKKSKPKAPSKRIEAEKERRAVRTEEEELEINGPDDEGHWMTVSKFRRYWDKLWSGYYGSFEDTSELFSIRLIPCISV